MCTASFNYHTGLTVEEICKKSLQRRLEKSLFMCWMNEWKRYSGIEKKNATFWTNKNDQMNKEDNYHQEIYVEIFTTCTLFDIGGFPKCRTYLCWPIRGSKCPATTMLANYSLSSTAPPRWWHHICRASLSCPCPTSPTFCAGHRYVPLLCNSFLVCPDNQFSDTCRG